MSANAIVPVVGRPPALFANRKSLLNAAAMAGVQASFAVIGYKGRNWRLKYRGEETMVMDARGAPVPSLDVIIVGVAPAISKQWYEQKYTEGNDDAPDCYSIDGVAPDQGSIKKQCDTCAICPHAQWGSRITDDGRKGKACQDNRRIAVVPLGDPENESYGGPMMLRIPPMSLNQLANYAQTLERKGASMEFVATRLGFDYNVAYPLITFEAVSWLSDEQAQLVVGADGNGGISGSEQMARVLGMVDTAAPQPAPIATEQAIPGTPLNIARANGPNHAQTQRYEEAAAAQQQAPAPHKPSPFMTGATPAQEQPNGHANGAAAFQAPKQTQAPAAPLTPAAQTAPAPTTAVQPAPTDMQSAIDELLNAPV